MEFLLMYKCKLAKSLKIKWNMLLIMKIKIFHLEWQCKGLLFLNNALQNHLSKINFALYFNSFNTILLKGHVIDVVNVFLFSYYNFSISLLTWLCIKIMVWFFVVFFFLIKKAGLCLAVEFLVEFQLNKKNL